MISKVLVTFAVALLAKAAIAAPDLVPFTSNAAIAIIQNPEVNGSIRIYYQPSLGAIPEYGVSGPFDVGRTIGNPVRLVPAAQVLLGTPISAVILSPGYTEESPISSLLIHVFFLSAQRVLSECYYSGTTTRWRGGPTCRECVTALGIQAAPGTDALSATIDVTHNVISVGFVDAKNRTLSEAIRRNGTWVVAPLPGY